MPQFGAEVTAIAYPYFRAARHINCKYRDKDKNFRMASGAERILYGLDDLASTTVIVEGEMDKLAVEVAGIRELRVGARRRAGAEHEEHRVEVRLPERRAAADPSSAGSSRWTTTRPASACRTNSCAGSAQRSV
jgi:hypothetical protein